MAKLYPRVLIFSLFIIFAIGTISWAISNEKLISSAEQLTHRWEKLLSNKHNIVCYSDIAGHWTVKRFKLIKNSMGYDIKKTDSIVTPYKLIIRFQVIIYSNFHSPNADKFVEMLNGKKGFSTRQLALKHTKNEDIRTVYTGGEPTDMIAIYAFQKNNWILKSGNDEFEMRFGLCSKDNVKTLAGVLKMTVK